MVENRKQKTKIAKRCMNRSWEVVFNEYQGPLSTLINAICKKQYGILKGFAVRHKKADSTSHVHMGLIFRDPPTQLTWAKLALDTYFKVGKMVPTVREQLKNKSRDFDKKLQTYWNYCKDQSKHTDEDISEDFLHKFKPKTDEEQQKPDEQVCSLIFDGMSVEELEDLIDNCDTPLKVRRIALRNFDIYEKMIIKFDEIRAGKLRRKQYLEDVKTYRPFQSGMTNILDTQNDRNIHNQCDNGITGKNYWLDKENKRTDTLILANAKTKNIAEAWDPRVHKRIIFDIPKGGAAYLNYRAIEALKNGQIFSEKYRSKPKCSSFKPSIIILTNEPIGDFVNWTEDRLTMSTTSKEDSYELIMQ